MNTSKALIFTLILGFLAFSGVIIPSPVVAQQDNGFALNYTELADEIQDRADPTDIQQTLDSDTIVRDVNWDSQNNTAYITIYSSNSEAVNFVDSKRLDEQRYAPNQFVQISGEKTVQVSAISEGGKQVITASTAGRGGGNIVLESPGGDLNIWQEILWINIAGIFTVLIALSVIYHKRKYDRNRLSGVVDKYTGETEETVFESDTIDTSTWTGKVKYHYLNTKERIVDIYYNPLGIVAGVLVLFVADRLLLNGYIWFTATGIEQVNILLVPTVFITVITYILGDWIRSLFYNPREIPILVLDQGEIRADHDNLKEAIMQGDDIQEGIRFLEMSQEVYDRFNTVYSEDLHEVPYIGSDASVKIARRVDLDEAQFLPNWEEIAPPEEVKKRKQYSKENNNLLRNYADSVKRLIGASSTIEEIAKRNAYEQVAEDFEEAFGEEETVSIDELVQYIMSTDDSDVQEEEVKAWNELKDAMTPSSQKKNIEKGGDND